MDTETRDANELSAEVKRRSGCPAFDVVKMFTASKASEREMLGETVTGWLASNPHLEIVDREITQSSDSEFHCVTITLFCQIREGIDRRSDLIRKHSEVIKRAPRPRSR